MEAGYLPTIPQQLHDQCPQISVKVVKLSSFEVSKNSGKTSARSTTLSEGERIGCERPLVTLNWAGNQNQPAGGSNYPQGRSRDLFGPPYVHGGGLKCG